MEYSTVLRGIPAPPIYNLDKKCYSPRNYAMKYLKKKRFCKTHKTKNDKAFFIIFFVPVL